jgi:membrane-bound ClpP family serine protease
VGDEVTLEAIFWIALGGGLALLILSLLLEEAGALSFMSAAAMTATPVAFTAAASFGAGGLVARLVFEMGRASIAAGAVTALITGGFTALLLMLLRREEVVDALDRSKLMGMHGTTALGMGPDRIGRVAVQYAGMTRSLRATSPEPIPAGERVVVQDVVGNLLRVAPTERRSSPEEVSDE